MSCEEEEDSSMDEDDDMPGLESVSSSEYVSDEDSVVFLSEGEEFPSPSRPVDSNSPNYITARKWLNQTRGDVLDQIHVTNVHLLSPFLYGCSHQTDKWLGWCFKVGLLQSDVNYNTGNLKDIELCAVYALDKAMEWCKESATREGISPATLAELLQLAQDVRLVSKLPRAIHLARKRPVFITMLERVRETVPPRSKSDTTERDPLFMETACLYVVSQAAEHVEDVINEHINIVKEHEDYCTTFDMKYDNMMTKGDDMKEQGRIKDCIVQYTTAVTLCPYNFKLYTNRAHCYITTKQHRAAMADGLRAVSLKPSWSEGHLRYIQGLDGCGMTWQASLARKRYAQLFPGQEDDINILSGLTNRPEPTAADRIVYDEIMKICSRASVSYQENNLTNTTYLYEKVWQKMKKNTGWRHCMEPLEYDRFMVSLHYTYGSALMGRCESVSIESSVTHFEKIMTNFTSVKFPAAYYAAGRAYTCLRQHSDAVAMAKLGLEMVTVSSACPPLTYPGTETVMEDSKRGIVEEKLKRLLQQCKITAIPDAVCRYANCLVYNSSSRIWSNHLDYRGHVTLDCNEDCAITYHPSCWRKCKTESGQKSDKEFLLTPCLTPDCCGYVNVVLVYDNKGAIKAKFEASAEQIAALTKKPVKQSLPSSVTVTGKKSKRRKNTEKDVDKPSPVSEDSKSLAKDEKRRPESDKSAKGKEREKGEVGKIGKEKGEGVKVGKEKGEGMKVGKEKGEGVKVGKEKGEGVKVVKEKCEGVKVGRENGEGGKVGKSSSEVNSGKGEDEKVGSVTGESGDVEKTEDVRRAEDSLAVIDRQHETETQETTKQKAKKKKVKKVAVVSGVAGGGGGGDHWNELFSLPEREGMVGEEAATDESWRPDPQAPFQTPSHLKEAVQEFERSQVPGMGLHPNTIPPAADDRDKRSTEDLEFIYSFFAEIFKTHGPLKPTEPTINESLSLLPEEKKILIEGAGGIATFLLQSPTFCSHEGLICLSEDSPVVAESVTHRPSSSEPLLVPPDDVAGRNRSSSGSTTSGSSPRDTPTDSPHIQKKTVDKPSKPGKKNKVGKSSKTASTAGEPSKANSTAREPSKTITTTREASKTTSTAQKPSKATSTAREVSGTTSKASNTVHEPSSASSTAREPSRSTNIAREPSKKTTTSAKTSSTAHGPSKTVSTESTNGSNNKQPVITIAGSSRSEKVENNKSSLQPVVSDAYETADDSRLIHRAVQTDRVLGAVRDAWVMTDPSPFSENFKERYEMVLREKIDLRAKLEESEDHRFKLQRDHKREIERLTKTIRQEAKEEAQVKIRELEGHVKDEKGRVQQEKKDQAEQLKAHKAEIKSLIDKVDRLKKEITKRDQRLDSLQLQHQTDMERVAGERRKLEERLRLAQDGTHLAMQRAITAEVDLLQQRVENVMRPGDARLLEIDRICAHIPPSNDLYREWMAYQDKLRTALECFQMAMEEQIQAVRSGRELSSMEKIPNPSVPLPAHLAFRGVPMVRPPFPGPMRMPMRGPPVPMGVRPVVEGQPLGFPPGQAGHPITPHPGVVPQHPIHHPQQPHMESPVTVSASLPLSGQEPPSSTTALPSLPSHPSYPPQPPLTAATRGNTEGEHHGSKSSFDRIVEKLVPYYPNYSREDFKMILREVRRNNRNTLSGLSLDSIADQVRGIIETRERAKGGEVGPKMKPRTTLPPVAQAPPPINTAMEYTDEWSCVICYEDMDSTDSSRLMCGHRFHTECIKSWFKEQNTCPTCRNYALLPDEYPFLSHMRS